MLDPHQSNAATCSQLFPCAQVLMYRQYVVSPALTLSFLHGGQSNGSFISTSTGMVWSSEPLQLLLLVWWQCENSYWTVSCKILVLKASSKHCWKTSITYSNEPLIYMVHGSKNRALLIIYIVPISLFSIKIIALLTESCVTIEDWILDFWGHI